MLAAIAFGLFHQNIQQVFYTALFGGFAAFIVIKTDSIYPAIVMHFVNNTVNVIWGYGSHYGWKLFTALDWFYSTGFGLIAFFLIGLAMVVGFTAILIYHSQTHKTQKQISVIYRPTLRDNAWLLGAGAIALASTLFSFAFGIY